MACWNLDWVVRVQALSRIIVLHIVLSKTLCAGSVSLHPGVGTSDVNDKG